MNIVKKNSLQGHSYFYLKYSIRSYLYINTSIISGVFLVLLFFHLHFKQKMYTYNAYNYYFKILSINLIDS